MHTETPEQREARHAALRAQLMSDLITGDPDPFDADVISPAAAALAHPHSEDPPMSALDQHLQDWHGPILTAGDLARAEGEHVRECRRLCPFCKIRTTAEICCGTVTHAEDCDCEEPCHQVLHQELETGGIAKIGGPYPCC